MFFKPFVEYLSLSTQAKMTAVLLGCVTSNVKPKRECFPDLQDFPGENSLTMTLSSYHLVGPQQWGLTRPKQMAHQPAAWPQDPPLPQPPPAK